MGRELRRKQAKKQKRTLVNEETKIESSITFKNLCKLLIITGVIFGLFYLATAIFMTKELDWFSKENETTTDTTQSVENTILAKEALSQKEDTYYVYFYDYTDEVSSVSTSVNSISDKVYKVNTKDGFNSNYVSEESNKNAKDINDLKVKELTLIKVNNGNIVEYYEGKKEINSNFGE